MNTSGEDNALPDNVTTLFEFARRWRRVPCDILTIDCVRVNFLKVSASGKMFNEVVQLMALN